MPTPRRLAHGQPARVNGTPLPSGPAGVHPVLQSGTLPHVLQVLEPQTRSVSQYATSLTEGLVASGWRVTVACPAEAERAEPPLPLGAEVLTLEPGRAPRAWQRARAVRRLARWCREQDVALVHGHGTEAGLLAALAARQANVPSVYTPHGWAFQRSADPTLRVLYALFERQLVHRFHARVLAASAFERAAGERWRVAPRGRIQVIRPGLVHNEAAITRAAARCELELPDDAVVAAWSGTIDDGDRPQDLAELARRLAGTVTVLAPYECRLGTALAQELANAGVVVASAPCPPSTLYAAADLALTTADRTGLPLVVLEAMSAKLPVVAYAAGCISEQIEAGRTGYLVRRGDVEMMSECVLALAASPVLRNRMGTAGQLRAASMFDSASVLERTLRAYLDVVGPAMTDASADSPMTQPLPANR